MYTNGTKNNTLDVLVHAGEFARALQGELIL